MPLVKGPDGGLLLVSGKLANNTCHCCSSTSAWFDYWGGRTHLDPPPNLAEIRSNMMAPQDVDSGPYSDTVPGDSFNTWSGAGWSTIPTATLNSWFVYHSHYNIWAFEDRGTGQDWLTCYNSLGVELSTQVVNDIYPLYGFLIGVSVIQDSFSPSRQDSSDNSYCFVLYGDREGNGLTSYVEAEIALDDGNTVDTDDIDHPLFHTDCSTIAGPDFFSTPHIIPFVSTVQSFVLGGSNIGYMLINEDGTRTRQFGEATLHIHDFVIWSAITPTPIIVGPQQNDYCFDGDQVKVASQVWADEGELWFGSGSRKTPIFGCGIWWRTVDKIYIPLIHINDTIEGPVFDDNFDDLIAEDRDYETAGGGRVGEPDFGFSQHYSFLPGEGNFAVVEKVEKYVEVAGDNYIVRRLFPIFVEIFSFDCNHNFDWYAIARYDNQCYWEAFFNLGFPPYDDSTRTSRLGLFVNGNLIKEYTYPGGNIEFIVPPTAGVVVPGVEIDGNAVGFPTITHSGVVAVSEKVYELGGEPDVDNPDGTLMNPDRPWAMAFYDNDGSLLWRTPLFSQQPFYTGDTDRWIQFETGAFNWNLSTSPPDDFTITDVVRDSEMTNGNFQDYYDDVATFELYRELLGDFRLWLFSPQTMEVVPCGRLTDDPTKIELLNSTLSARETVWVGPSNDTGGLQPVPDKYSLPGTFAEMYAHRKLFP